MKGLLTYILLITALSVRAQQVPKAVAFSGHTNHFMVDMLQKDSSAIIKRVMANPARFRVQIIFTRITRDKKYGYPTVQKYYFRVDPNEYFYPASTIKLPLALLTLDKFKTLDTNQVNAFTAMKTSSNFAPPAVYKGADSLLHYHSMAYHMNKALVVSDNLAPNYMYEFLGLEHINERLKDVGFNNTVVRTRFAKSDPMTNPVTGSITFLDQANKKLYEQDSLFSTKDYPNPLGKKAVVGKGYLQNGRLIRRPRDFSKDNYTSLEDLDEMMTGIMFPELNRKLSKLNLDIEDYEYLQYLMNLRPRKSTYPAYKPENLYSDAFRKYILVGTCNDRIDDHMVIINKVGMAYGFLTDIAYINDQLNNIEFMVSAVIYANTDEILNDNNYDYDRIGLPFLSELGRMFYNYEYLQKQKR